MESGEQAEVFFGDFPPDANPGLEEHVEPAVVLGVKQELHAKGFDIPGDIDTP